MFIADFYHCRIREVDLATGIITSIAGNGTPGFSGDGGAATTAELDLPLGTAVDSSGNLFIADFDNNRIREVDHATGIITTVAGNGSYGFRGDGGPATAAELYHPAGVAVDSSGDLFIADAGNNSIRKVDPATGVITTVAGNGAGSFRGAGYSGDGGAATAAKLDDPSGVAVDSSGDLFIADSGNNRIREVNHATGIITTVAGNGTRGFTGDGGQATAAEIYGPGGVAVDSSGDLFIADSGNNRIREVDPATGVITTVADGGGGVAVDSSGDLFIADHFNQRIREVDLATGIITTVAGNGTRGYGGDRGQATAAELADPSGVAFDSSGHLFIADKGNQRIRELDLATGVITTVAGGGTSGLGDGGPATAAELSFPTGVAVDSSGDLFIADQFNNRIREVDLATGVITTVAGNGIAGFSGDGGQATAAELNEPEGVAIDSSGNLFVADQYNHRIREVNLATGIITTVAGNGGFGFSGDGGAATAAQLYYPLGVTVDSSGELLIADNFNDRIREVDLATGVITTVAGGGSSGLGDGGAATAAQLANPWGVAVDSSGDLFIADQGNDRIREVDPATGVITTVAGNGTAGLLGDGGQATTAELSVPRGVAVDPSGDLFIADQDNHRIREVDPATGVITTVAGGGTSGLGDGGPATAAELNFPSGVAVDSSGDLFIADEFNNRVREVNLATGVITTVAGNGTAGFSGDGGPATAAELNLPSGVAADSSGDLFIADSGNNRIRKVDLATDVVTTVAGNGTAGISGDGGQASAAELNFPSGVAADSSGDLFIADGNNARIRKVNLATGVITTVAGNGSFGFKGDGGLATAAALAGPHGVVVDSSGDLFIADVFNNRIREVELATGVITTVAGNGTAGYSGDGGPATAAKLNAPSGVAVDSSGNLFIADGNHRIREVASGTVVAVAPAPLTITADDKSKVYGAALPTLTVSFSGFVDGDSAASLTTQPTLSTTATTSSQVPGSPYPITASGAVDPNYTITSVPGKLTVTAAALTITANDQSMVFGGGLPALTVTYSGLVNGDTPDTFGDSPNVPPTVAAPATNHVGNYAGAIVASGAVNPDYTITYVPGKLTVTAAALTITANDQTMVYGGALPALTVSYSGLANGDRPDTFGVSPNVAPTVTAPAANHVGSYVGAIVASDAVDPDYTIAYVSGKLTVTPTPLTITADNKTKVYGADIPTLTANYAGLVNGDTSASLTALPTLASTGTAGSHVAGSPYRITASGAVDADYTISYVPGVLDITPATVSVTADDKTKQEGAENPTLTYTITGFVNGDSPGVVSGEPNISTTATTASDARKYPIIVAAGTFTAADYTFRFQNGTLTVTANAQGTFGAVEDVYVIGSGTVSVSAANGVLANDSGPGQLAVTPAIATGAEGGKFEFNADGSFTYTPPNGFPGFDYANYTASDSQGDQATATVNVLSQTGGVVWKFYEQVLDRDPDYAGLQGWINDFLNGGKPGDIAAGFFESTELLNQIITGFYQQYLGRAPAGGDLDFWGRAWREAGGPEPIKAQFASSQEFNNLANKQHGDFPDGWITALYERILNRTPQGNDLPFWDKQLADGATEGQVALEFFTSPEAFGDDVMGWFDEYLGREPTPAEQAQYANQMLGGASDRDTEQAITNLPEYSANPPASPAGAGVRLPDYFPAVGNAMAKQQGSLAATDAVFARLA